METIDLLNQRYGRGCAGAGVGERGVISPAHTSSWRELPRASGHHRAAIAA
ncbi:TPA: DUF4113 domain-containing protein [Pseudomonas aeruginosa]|uniref:DUF4113 domain-containing protein n=1 Tax=Pseudomonas aeruginosa TaxID=287 RepID=UPI000FF459D2|nr:DUF4113 domain-containing protein [Pseudomonas aeruginosa]MBX5854800.1 DUF4113 domain-containing protein [Pseudomonas aeruginosa]MCD2812698.1 DUF4113 domain-containing protein [Pseudomonas aeruginosa]MCH0748166.1 DUF4113 domain-containing protein [Pseudomonas aeruginosa]RWX95668.1 DUF4113 domain-containing protein [Pseudomonas aeruginosa]